MTPRLSILVQFFNRRRHVAPVVRALHALDDVELVICEDGSVDGSHREWLKRMRSNDVLVRSNDLHEIRAYDRAATMAAGSILCFLQDDDLPPAAGEWVEKALDLFALHTRLGILGGFKGYELELSDSGHAARVKRRIDRPVCLDPVSRVPFMFVQAVNLAPLFIRRETFEATGFDHRFSSAGESGILFDQEICLHAWNSGWQVGLYDAPFERRVGGRGTLIFSRESRERNFKSNLGLLGRMYGDRMAAIAGIADQLNRTLQCAPGSRPL